MYFVRVSLGTHLADSQRKVDSHTLCERYPLLRCLSKTITIVYGLYYKIMYVIYWMRTYESRYLTHVARQVISAVTVTGSVAEVTELNTIFF